VAAALEPLLLGAELRRLALLGLALCAPAAAQEPYVSLEAALPPRPGWEAEAAPRRLVLFEDGTLYVGGSQSLAVGRLEKGELEEIGKRLDKLRKSTPGLGGTLSFGPGDQRYRLRVAKGKPLDVVVSGDPAAAPPELRPLAGLVAELAAYQHPSLRPYRPAFYAVRAREASLRGGCREWTFPIPLSKALEAPQPMSAVAAQGWPTGAQVASACVGDKSYAVTLRPLLPSEAP
jgi:hypothetical protein